MEDRSPHNPFQVEAITVFWTNICAHSYCISGDRAMQYDKFQKKCDMPTTRNQIAPGRGKIIFSQLCLPSSTADTCTASHYKPGTCCYTCTARAAAASLLCNRSKGTLSSLAEDTEAVTKWWKRYMTWWSWSLKYVCYETQSTALGSCFLGPFSRTAERYSCSPPTESREENIIERNALLVQVTP